MTRQIVLDTETTGLETSEGHRIIEIGAVEMIDRKLTGENYHVYINPQREVDEGAASVHGMTLADLKDKPLFKDIVADFVDFVKDAELIIHNAPFDVGFINYEFSLLHSQDQTLEQMCQITDSLTVAREIHPGQRNNLDALCKRYHIDNTQRTLHGALLDAEILADVYLAMTGGQITFLDGQADSDFDEQQTQVQRKQRPENLHLKVIQANEQESKEHEAWLDFIEQQSSNGSLWRNLNH